MSLSTPALVTLGLIGGLVVFSTSSGGSRPSRPPVATTPPPPGGYQPPPAPSPGGSGNADVRRLQQVLNAIRAKYAYTTFAPLDEDGYLGALTEEAADDILHAVYDTLLASGAGHNFHGILNPVEVIAGVPGLEPIGMNRWTDYLETVEVNGPRQLADWMETYVLNPNGSLLG